MSGAAGTSLTGALALLDRLMLAGEWIKAESVASQMLAQIPTTHRTWATVQGRWLLALRKQGKLAKAIAPPYAAGRFAEAEALFNHAHGGAALDLTTDAGNASILYVPEGFRADPRMIMGRQVAGESFLQGWFRHALVAGFHAVTRGPSAALDFANRAAAMRPALPTRWRFMGGLDDRPFDCQTLFQPDPMLADLAWSRARTNPAGFSLVGITHTLSTETVMAGIAGLVDAPLGPWDAVICTSQAGRRVVQGLLDARCAALAHRLGLPSPVIPPLPQLPVIPLGIDSAAFAPNPADRAALRTELGIGADDIVVLARGRICRDHKGHPAPLLRTLGLAAGRQTGKQWHLVVAGWFADADEQHAFTHAMPLAAPAQVHVLDGRAPTLGNRVWSMADIFVSLPDNIQETFGVTPIEAMAAGLPCIVSDWNGYRETVEPACGIRIPTLLAQAGGEALAGQLADHLHPYRDYLRGVSARCAINISATAEALVQLGGNADLRRQMGAAGQALARSVYDWAAIIPQYQTLFRELSAIRHATAPQARWPTRPSHPNPLALFGHFATQTLQADTRIIPQPAGIVDWPMDALAQAVLHSLPAEGTRLAALHLQLGTVDDAHLHQAVAWLAKGGWVRWEP